MHTALCTMCIAVHCSGQWAYIAMQCSGWYRRCSLECILQRVIVQCITVHWSVWYWAVVHIAVFCSAEVQCVVVQCITVHWSVWYCSSAVCGIGCRYWSEEAEAASICRAGPQTTFNQLKTNFSHFLCNSYIFRTFSAKFTFSTLSHFILDNLQAIDSSTFSSKCISPPLINVLHFWAEKARTNSRDAFWKWTTKSCIDRNIIQTNEKYSVSMVRNTI